MKNQYKTNQPIKRKHLNSWDCHKGKFTHHRLSLISCSQKSIYSLGRFHSDYWWIYLPYLLNFYLLIFFISQKTKLYYYLWFYVKKYKCQWLLTILMPYFMYHRCCVCTDGGLVRVSGNGQRFPAGPAFTPRSHDLALQE